jgi:hypothetical protein
LRIRQEDTGFEEAIFPILIRSEVAMVTTCWDHFIVYSRKDAEIAREWYFALGGIGTRVFWDKESIRETDDWVKSIRAAQLSARCFVVLVTHNLVAAHFAQDEILTAIDLQRRNPAQIRILPVLLEDVFPLPYGLSVFQSVDARHHQPREIAARLTTMADTTASADDALPFAVPIIEHPLHAYPRTGFTPSEMITVNLLDALSDIIPRTERRLTVDRANAFRREADPNEPDLPVIRHAALAPEDVAQGRVYWGDVLQTARVNSPRMLAAVLLSIDTSAFPPKALTDLKRLLNVLQNTTAIG